MNLRWMAGPMLGLTLTSLLVASPATAQDSTKLDLPAPVEADLTSTESRLVQGALAGAGDTVAVLSVATKVNGRLQVSTLEVAAEDATKVEKVLDAQPSVTSADVSSETKTFADPHRNLQWPLNTLKATQARQVLGNTRPVVAVIDTGVDGAHPDLDSIVLSGKDLIATGNAKIDPNGHGTHVAGIIGAEINNGIGVEGFLPNVSILPVRVLDADGRGNTAVAAQGVVWAVDNGADVINLSLGGGDDTTLRAAVDYAAAQGVVVVAAMGNSAQEGNPTNYPAAYPGVIAVAATDSNNTRGSFSNHGPHAALSAPGVQVASTVPGQGYSYMTGTSMATPYVAAAAAAVQAKYTGISPAQVSAHLKNTADDLGTAGFDNYYGHGLVDPLEALSSAPAGWGATVVAPSAPQNVAATPSPQGATITWAAPAAAGSATITNYNVSVKTGTSAVVVQTLQATARTATFSSLTNGSLYTVTVNAVSSAGSSPSATTTVTPRSAPSVPSISSADGGDQSISVVWSPSFDNGAPVTGYQVVATANNNPNVTASVDGQTTQATLTGLKNGVSYQVVVTASNVAGTSVPSSPAYSMPRGLPSAPSPRWAQAGDQSVKIAWNAPTTDGGQNITNYLVTATSDSDVKTVEVGVVYQAEVTGLTNDQEYTLTVEAKNAGGYSPKSSVLVATPVSAPAVVVTPGAPTITSVTSGAGEISINWDAPSDTGNGTIYGYTVELTQNGVAQYHEVTGATSTTITGLQNGVRYTVVVQAKNSAGSGLGSNALSATPRTNPGTPTITSVVPGATALTVNWAAPTSDGGAPITGYQVSVSGPNYAKTYQVSGTVRTLALPGLLNGVSYQVSVQAQNVAGTGVASAAVAGTPRGVTSAPVITSVVPGNGALTVNWTPPTNLGGAAVTGYQVTVSRKGYSKVYQVAATGKALTMTGLANGYGYSVQVQAKNVAGVSLAALSSGMPRTVTTSPVITKTAVANAAMAVYWSSPTNLGGAAVTGYQVTISRRGYSKVYQVGPTVRALNMPGLTNGWNHTVQVQARNAAGLSAVATSYGIPRTVPSAPLSPKVGSGSTRDKAYAISTSWAAPASNGGMAITGYTVRIRKAGTSTDIIKNVGGTVRSLVVTGLSRNASYSITVQAQNVAGGSALSARSGSAKAL